MSDIFRPDNWKECQNCWGEGKVIIWGLTADEVPASRKRKYPTDYPHGNIAESGNQPYECPECKGHGGWFWGRDYCGQKVWGDLED